MKKNKIFLFLMVMAAAIVGFASCKQEVLPNEQYWVAEDKSTLTIINDYGFMYVPKGQASAVVQGNTNKAVKGVGKYELKSTNPSGVTYEFEITEEGSPKKLVGKLKNKAETEGEATVFTLK